MSASALLKRAAAAGVAVELKGDRLLLSAKQQPDESLLQELRREKPNIVAHLLLATRTDEDWQAFFDERAGILEFDGGLCRVEAEAQAEKEAETCVDHEGVVGAPDVATDSPDSPLDAVIALMISSTVLARRGSPSERSRRTALEEGETSDCRGDKRNQASDAVSVRRMESTSVEN